MEENVNAAEVCQPQQTEEVLPSEKEVTTPPADKTDSAFVEVKFNKELKRLSLDEAATLAQKGMKFELVAGELERLKKLSAAEGMSVGDYLTHIETKRSDRRREELAEKCGGDTALAEKLLKLEDIPMPDSMAQLKEEFPDLTEESLPEEVKTAAKLKGTGLLFEYLLYEHRQRVATAEEIARSRKTAEESLGSLNSEPARSAADAEFLKGVWGR